MKARGVVIAVTCAIAVCLAAGAAIAGARDAGITRSGSKLAHLRAAVSNRHPCGDPIYLKARATNASGNGVKGVKVTFSFTLKTGPVAKHGFTGADGRVKVKVTPTPTNAPDGVRIDVAVEGAKNGVVRTASTWFTPRYT